MSCSFIVSTVLVSTDGPTAPGDLTVNSWAAQEAPEKRPQAAACQQSFVKLGLMAYPSGCETSSQNGGSRLDHQSTGVLGVIGPLLYCDLCIIK